ncbi:MAG: hypothetical protein H6982_03025 [Chromatiales bacterium]|nr:hypothetical protein [Chromatiales bacterium]
MSIRRSSARAAVVAAALCAAAPVAQAAPIVFLGLDNAFMPSPRPNADAARDAFVAAAGAATLVTQDFESAALGALPAGASTGTFANGVGVTVDNTATDYLRVASGVGPFDTYPVSGSRYLESLSAEGSTYFTASFDQPLRAIGFYITDASDWIGTPGPIAPLVVSLTTLSGTFDFDLTGSVDPTTIVDGNVAFFGALSAGDPITSVAIANPGSNPDEDAIGIDDVMVAVQSVPVPQTLTLLGAGLALLGWGRRRA